MALSLSLGSSFDLRRDGEPITLKNKKAQALLAYLALTGQPQSREHLATLLWGDRFDEQARNSLRQALFALRKAVGDDVVIGDDTLALGPGQITMDVAGEVLPGFTTGADRFDGWLETERSKLRRSRLETAESKARRLAEKGQHDAAISACKAGLDIDPLDESLLRLLLKQLAVGGRRAEAMIVFEQFQERLSEELGIEPSQDTLDLVEGLRSAKGDVRKSFFGPDHMHVVCMPFDDLGGGETARYFSQSLPVEIAAKASEVGWLTAIPPTAVTAEFGDDANPLSVGRKLGANLSLTGSARQIGERIRIALQILNVKTGTPVWSHREDVREDRAFDAHDFLVGLTHNAVWSSTHVIDTDLDVLSVLDKNRDNPRAIIRAVQDMFPACFQKEHSRHSMRHFATVAARAAEYLPREPFIASMHSVGVFNLAHLSDGKDRFEKYRKSLEIAGDGLANHPKHQQLHVSITQAAGWLGDFETAARHFEFLKSTSAGPIAMAMYGASLAFQGKRQAALDLMQESLRNESGSAIAFYRLSNIALVHFVSGDYKSAAEYARRATEGNSEFFMAHLILIAASQCLGEKKAAREAVTSFRESYREPSVSEFRKLPFADPNVKNTFFDALSEAGLPE